MSRDNSDIYTGATSSEPTAREERKEAKREAKITLTESGELIMAEIAKERRAIAKEQGELIGVDTKAGDVKAILIGLNTADRRVASLGNRLNNLLRE